MHRFFSAAVLLTLLSLPVLGKQVPSLLQSRYNAQIEVPSLAEVPGRVESICRECQAQITNFNSDLQSGSGNLNVRVPEDKLGRCIEGLRQLGTVRSENRSVSDQTSSYRETTRNLDLYEKTMAARWTVSGDLSPAERGLVDTEFRSFLRDRINSYRGQLAGYEQNQGWAEVSISLRAPQPAALAPEATPPPPAAPVATADYRLVGMALFGPAMLMLGLIAIFLFKQLRAQGRPEPYRAQD